ERLRERTCDGAVGLRPGVVLGPDRGGEDPPEAIGVGDRPVEVMHAGDLEPVPGERAGLVGDDEVDRAEDLLGIESADEDAAAEEPARTEAEDDGDEEAPDEPVEFLLERAPTAVAATEPAGDPTDLGRGPGRDDDSLAAAAD